VAFFFGSIFPKEGRIRRTVLTIFAAVLLVTPVTVGWGLSAEIEADLLALAREGDPAKVEDLLRKGADVNARSQDGQTALMKTAGAGHGEVVN